VPATRKNRRIARARRHCVSCEIGDEDADNQAIREPHAQELRHDGWAAGKYGHHPDRSLPVLLDQGRRLHFFMGSKREVIVAALQARGAQGGEDQGLIGDLLAVAFVVRQHRVHDGAGNKHNHCRKQDREPKGDKRDHALSPCVL
jgi:hypothetical protein